MRTLHVLALLACGALPLAILADDLRVSGPYNHDNLSIFLIHGAGGGKSYLTLREAMEQKKVVVYETKQVNELAIENTSDKDVFVQGGDIVKGGQQDRVLPTDFVLPAKSGKMPISAFCVEPGRWTQRGAEPVHNFSASTDTVANPDMAKAMKVKKNQSEVWDQVAKINAGIASGRVAAVASSSSLQVTLESKPVSEAVDGYLKTLAGIVDGKSDVVGFALTVNGKINSADIYSSNALFRAMWPKLLKAGAVEAVRFKGAPSSPLAAVDDVQAFLRDAEADGVKTSTAQAGRMTLVNAESAKVLTFESQDNKNWIHRNYLVK